MHVRQSNRFDDSLFFVLFCSKRGCFTYEPSRPAAAFLLQTVGGARIAGKNRLPGKDSICQQHLCVLNNANSRWTCTTASARS